MEKIFNQKFFLYRFFTPVSGVDTGGEFAASVVDTGDNLPLVSLIAMVHLDLRISLRIFEKITLLFSGACGKMIREKTCSKKSRDTVPLTYSKARGLMKTSPFD